MTTCPTTTTTTRARERESFISKFIEFECFIFHWKISSSFMNEHTVTSATNLMGTHVHSLLRERLFCLPIERKRKSINQNKATRSYEQHKSWFIFFVAINMNTLMLLLLSFQSEKKLLKFIPRKRFIVPANNNNNNKIDCQYNQKINWFTTRPIELFILFIYTRIASFLHSIEFKERFYPV